MVSSTPRPYFTTGKDPVPILQEVGWVPGPVWTGGKSRPTGIRSPDCPARSQSLYRLSYPAHGDVQLYSFFNLGARWAGWSKPIPGRFISNKDQVPFIKNIRMESKSRIRRALPPYNIYITWWCLDKESVIFLLFHCDRL